MANAFYDDAVDDIVASTIDLTGTLKVMLLGTGARGSYDVYSFDSSDSYATVAGYATQTLTLDSNTYVGGVLDAADEAFTAGVVDRGWVSGLVLFADSGSRLIAYWEVAEGLPFRQLGTSITITWHSTGLLSISDGVGTLYAPTFTGSLGREGTPMELVHGIRTVLRDKLADHIVPSQMQLRRWYQELDANGAMLDVPTPQSASIDVDLLNHRPEAVRTGAIVSISSSNQTGYDARQPAPDTAEAVVSVFIYVRVPSRVTLGGTEKVYANTLELCAATEALAFAVIECLRFTGSGYLHDQGFVVGPPNVARSEMLAQNLADDATVTLAECAIQLQIPQEVRH